MKQIRYPFIIFTLFAIIKAPCADHYKPWVAPLRHGNFVVVWYDNRSGDLDIYAQRFTSDGTPLGINFRVNDHGNETVQRYCAIDSDASENFVIVWVDDRNNGRAIYGQRFSETGTRLGGNFEISDDPGNHFKTKPAVAMDREGNFLVVWFDDRIKFMDLFAQGFNHSGMPTGSNFRVNVDERGGFPCCPPAITADREGQFFIVWAGPSIHNIYARRFSLDGTSLDDTIEVDDDNAETYKFRPSIARNPNGQILVAWEDERANQDALDVYGQWFDPNGITVDQNFYMVHGGHPSLALDKSGKIFLTFSGASVVENGSGYSTTYSNGYVQRFRNDGNLLGESFSFCETGGATSRTAMDETNDLIIVWPEKREFETDIYARKIANNGTLIGEDFKVNDDVSTFPNESTLYRNYPNPFNLTTRIRFLLTQPTLVKLTIYNILGEKIETPLNETMPKGFNEMEWHSNDYPSGIYIARLETEGYTETIKMVLEK